MPTPIPSQANISNRATSIAAIASAAERTGVDFKYLLGQAQIESGLNPDAAAKTSSATGLFQFTRQTWLATVKENGAEHGYSWAANAISRNSNGRYRIADPKLRDAILDLRKNPQAASNMAAEFAGDNAEFLTSRTGQQPEPVDLYLAHFLGAGGAAKFLAAYSDDPDAVAAPLFPAAASANRPIFYNRDGSARSFAEIRGRFAARLDQSGAVPPHPSRSIPLRHASWVIPAPVPPSTPNEQADRSALALHKIEAMPKRLSLEFAASSYRRLAAIEGDRR